MIAASILFSLGLPNSSQVLGFLAAVVAVLMTSAVVFLEVQNQKTVQSFGRSIAKVRSSVQAFERDGIVARHKADEILESLSDVANSEMDLVIARDQMSDGRGAMLWSGQPARGSQLNLWQMWLEIPGFFDGPVAGLHASFSDNTQSQAVVTGSTTLGKSWGSGKAYSSVDPWTQRPSGSTTIYGSGNSASHTVNHIAHQASGHASVHITGPKLDYVLLFSDALLASEIANLINSWAMHTYEERLNELERQMVTVRESKQEVVAHIPSFLKGLGSIPSNDRAAIVSDFERAGYSI